MNLVIIKRIMPSVLDTHIMIVCQCVWRFDKYNIIENALRGSGLH